MYQRHQRVESLIREALNEIIIRELEFPGALVTLTGVNVQKDLDYAEIGVSVLPGEKSEEALKALEKNKGHLRHILLRKINIKPLPELRFFLDTGLEKAAELEKKFIELEKEESGE